MILDQTFKGDEYTVKRLPKAKCENCVFEGCDFSNGHLDNQNFMECELIDCTLDFSSFYGMSLKNQIFKACTLVEVDFTEADLTLAIFDGSNLKNTIFDNTILEKANFTSVLNFTIDPEKNRLKKAKFSKNKLWGLLKKHEIRID